MLREWQQSGQGGDIGAPTGLMMTFDPEDLRKAGRGGASAAARKREGAALAHLTPVAPLKNPPHQRANAGALMTSAIT
jgi:hypothetical protein